MAQNTGVVRTELNAPTFTARDGNARSPSRDRGTLRIFRGNFMPFVISGGLSTSLIGLRALGTRPETWSVAGASGFYCETSWILSLKALLSSGALRAVLFGAVVSDTWLAEAQQAPKRCSFCGRSPGDWRRLAWELRLKACRALQRPRGEL